MDSTQLLAELRQAAWIGDQNAFPDYSDLKLLAEMTNRLRVDFTKPIVDSMEGYLTKTIVVTGVVDGKTRIPARAIDAGLYTVEYLNSSGNFCPLDEIAIKLAYRFQSEQTTVPRKYTLQGGNIFLHPTPTVPVTLRIRFYLRPSTLTAAQNSVNGTDRGRITSITPGVSITVNALPFDNALTVPVAMTTSNAFDIIRPAGWYEADYFSQTISSIVGTTITPIDASWITTNNVFVGDYVRVANQSDWPMIPEDYHEVLADLGACKVLNEQGDTEKEQALMLKTQAGYERFTQSLVPRAQVNSHPIYVRGRY